MGFTDAKDQSSPPHNADVKAAFHKPSNDASSRNYRRHSPVNDSSSSDESRENDKKYSLRHAREDASKSRDYRERSKADEKDLYKDSGKPHYSRDGDSYKHSDRHGSRSSHGYSRADEQTRHDKRIDGERDYEKSTYGSRDSRRGTHSDHSRRESDYSRSKDFNRDTDRYLRDKYDSLVPRSKGREKESGRRKNDFEESERDRNKRSIDDRGERRDYYKSSGDHRNDRTLSREESRGHHGASTVRRDTDGHPSKEVYRSMRDRDSEKLGKDKKSSNDWEIVKDKDPQKRGAEKHSDDTAISKSDKSSPTKRQRVFSSEVDPACKEDGLKESQEAVNANEAQVQSSVCEATNDLNAAKFAAMKAAEMVNRNLAGGIGPAGYMSTEQKKKLLWGSKKSAAADESGNHWDVSLIADRERQEKFNKLMGVKGDVKVEQKPTSQDGSSLLRAEKQKELQQDLEKQYTAGLRRRDGRTVGLGL